MTYHSSKYSNSIKPTCEKEVEKIVNAYNKNLSTYKIMLCTEKDWSKLRKWKDFFETNGIKVGYLPIVFGFVPKDKSHFENSILEYVKSAQTEYRLFNSTH